jgi:hypothetical protein
VTANCHLLPESGGTPHNDQPTVSTPKGAKRTILDRFKGNTLDRFKGKRNILTPRSKKRK